MSGLETCFLLLPDGREPEAALRQVQEATGRDWITWEGWPPRWELSYHRDDPMTVVSALYAVDWEYPPLLVYRSSDQQRWSYLQIVRQGNPWAED